MPARDEHRRWSVTRLELQAWRNFSRQTEMHLGGRAFFIGPNASGKSNILDALRFLRDVAAEGLQIASLRPRSVCSRTDIETDNDHADTPTTMSIDELFFLSVSNRTQPSTEGPTTVAQHGAVRRSRSTTPAPSSSSTSHAPGPDDVGDICVCAEFVSSTNKASGCSSSTGVGIGVAPSLRRHRSNVLSANPCAAQNLPRV